MAWFQDGVPKPCCSRSSASPVGVPRISTPEKPASAMSATSARRVSSSMGPSGSHQRIFGRTCCGGSAKVAAVTFTPPAGAASCAVAGGEVGGVAADGESPATSAPPSRPADATTAVGRLMGTP